MILRHASQKSYGVQKKIKTRLICGTEIRLVDSLMLNTDDNVKQWHVHQWKVGAIGDPIESDR